MITDLSITHSQRRPSRRGTESALVTQGDVVFELLADRELLRHVNADAAGRPDVSALHVCCALTADTSLSDKGGATAGHDVLARDRTGVAQAMLRETSPGTFVVTARVYPSAEAIDGLMAALRRAVCSRHTTQGGGVGRHD